jgi:hypothetical protein
VIRLYPFPLHYGFHRAGESQKIFEEIYIIPKGVIAEIQHQGARFEPEMLVFCHQTHLKKLEYPEAVRACAMRRYPWNLGTFLILIVFFHSSGCRPYFIFLSFYSVVYSI